jgi:hypothetical protein
VSEQVARIRAAVLRRHGFEPGADDYGAIPDSAIDEAARRCVVNAHWGIASETPIVGPMIVYARRAMRIGLRWYINPIVEQQNEFNEAVVRALHELKAENDDLRARLEGINRERPVGQA